jgi:para-nitrobenzyl esterase
MNDPKERRSGVNRRHVLGGVAGIAAGDALRGFDFAQAMEAGTAPVASTTSGKVRGLGYRGVLAFRGVPYGGPASGAGRFLPPTEPAPWTEVRDATHAGPRAWQVSSPQAGTASIFRAPVIGPYFSGGRADMPVITDEAEDENCLVLNVLTPALSGRRPVLVYIHGGGFAQGTGALTLGGDRLVAEHDVVLVGINHRLNALGYTLLASLDPKFADSGNLGQLDLVLALRWVKANIAAFGGDPSNVTVFGESGGGGKISTLLAMPSAKGLFKRAIIESGSMLAVRTREAAEADTRKLLSALNLDSNAAAALAALPARQLIDAAARAGVSFGPVVDGRSVPHQTWQQGAPPEAAGVSLLVGTCKDESSLFAMGDPALFTLDWSILQERVSKSGIPADKADALIAQYRATNPKDSASDIWFRLSSDRGARRNAIRQAEAKLAQSDAVYMYYFAWNTGLEGGKLRAFHTAELPLVMRLVLNPAAEELSKQLAGAWAAFARTGNPNHRGLPQWDRYSSSARATLVFDAGASRAVQNPAQAELALLAPYTGALL